MKLLKWLLVFAAAFLAACVLIFTFSQEPFRQLVPARILTWRTPAVPIYTYVAGAFGMGLLFGLLTMLYYYIVLQSKAHRLNRTIKSLEEQLADAKKMLEANGLSSPPDVAADGAAGTDGASPPSGGGEIPGGAGGAT